MSCPSHILRIISMPRDRLFNAIDNSSPLRSITLAVASSTGGLGGFAAAVTPPTPSAVVCGSWLWVLRKDLRNRWSITLPPPVVAGGGPAGAGCTLLGDSVCGVQNLDWVEGLKVAGGGFRGGRALWLLLAWGSGVRSPSTALWGFASHELYWLESQLLYLSADCIVGVREDWVVGLWGW